MSVSDLQTGQPPTPHREIVDLVDLENEGATSFHIVRFGSGYDRHEVDDYVDRVEASFDEADRLRAEQEARLESLQQQVTALREQLEDAERRAAGRPEAASKVANRLAQMLTLAEQEAAEMREQAAAQAAHERSEAHQAAQTQVREAREQAEAIVRAAREQAEQNSAALAAELARREREVVRATEAAEAATLQAQRDAEAVRAQAKRDVESALSTARREAAAQRQEAQREAEEMTSQARQDVQLLHDTARKEVAAAKAQARRELEDLARQRDTIAAQLQTLRDTVSAAVAPLSGQQGTGSRRVHDGGQASGRP